MLKIVAFIVTVFSLMSCVVKDSLKEASAINNVSAEDNVAEAIIRDHLKWYYSSRLEQTASNSAEQGFHYYISMYGDSFKDPTDEFMARFKDMPIVSVVSKSMFREDGAVVDKETLYQSTIYQINSVVVLDTNKAEAIVTIVNFNDCKNGYHYYLTGNDGKWLVINMTIPWNNCPRLEGHDYW